MRRVVFRAVDRRVVVLRRDVFLLRLLVFLLAEVERLRLEVLEPQIDVVRLLLIVRRFAELLPVLLVEAICVSLK